MHVDIGKALNDNSKRMCRNILISGPVNTNAMVCQNAAKDLPVESFTGMTRIF